MNGNYHFLCPTNAALLELLGCNDLVTRIEGRYTFTIDSIPIAANIPRRVLTTCLHETRRKYFVDRPFEPIDGWTIPKILERARLESHGLCVDLTLRRLDLEIEGFPVRLSFETWNPHKDWVQKVMKASRLYCASLIERLNMFVKDHHHELSKESKKRLRGSWLVNEPHPRVSLDSYMLAMRSRPWVFIVEDTGTLLPIIEYKEV